MSDPRLRSLAAAKAAALEVLSELDRLPLDRDDTRELRSLVNEMLGQIPVVAERITQGLI